MAFTLNISHINYSEVKYGIFTKICIHKECFYEAENIVPFSILSVYVTKMKQTHVQCMAPFRDCNNSKNDGLWTHFW